MVKQVHLADVISLCGLNCCPYTLVVLLHVSNAVTRGIHFNSVLSAACLVRAGKGPREPVCADHTADPPSHTAWMDNLVPGVQVWQQIHQQTPLEA